MEQQNEPLFGFPVETSTQRSLLSAAGWSRFLAILGFVALGIILIALILGGKTMISQFQNVLTVDTTALAGIIIVIVLIVIAVIGVLSFLLFRGANLVKKGIYANSQDLFNAGLASYRTFFLLYGILSVFSLLLNIYQLF